MAAKSEGITFNPDGTIDVVVDGTVRHLRRPKLREYRYWAEQLRELAKNAQAEAVRLQELVAELGEEPEDEKLEEINAELERANQARIEYATPWTSGVVEQFSGNPLPEDADDWPAWLALDVSIPAQILNHWKRVPLAPGAAGKN